LITGNDFITDAPTTEELRKVNDSSDPSLALEVIVSRNLRHYPVHKIRLVHKFSVF